MFFVIVILIRTTRVSISFEIDIFICVYMYTDVIIVINNIRGNIINRLVSRLNDTIFLYSRLHYLFWGRRISKSRTSLMLGASYGTCQKMRD